MNAKHTSGPWILDKEVSFLMTEDGYAIAEWRLTYSSIKQDEQCANARLMAAAPDLLAAAQKALDECCDLAETDAGRSLLAAISKATGSAT